jgi:4-amino-4-deoxy-L-arabinose transferase-like glycosyltransferase
MNREQNRSILSYPVLLILIVGLIIRIIIAIVLNPGYDEAYYYLYSRNLAWSYFDHPVLVALTTGLGVWLTGEVNQFTLRIGTLILTTISLYLLYLTAQKLFNSQSALLTLVIASVIPIFTLAFGVLTLPDVPLIFFWTLTLWLVSYEFFAVSASSYQPTYRLALIGICVGLACLGKYHGFILGLGLVGFCLTNSPYRRVFTSPWLWLAGVLFGLTLFPIWYWNAQHDWISFTFQLSGRFQSWEEKPEPTTISLINLVLFWLAGIGYLFPSFGFPLWWITSKSLYGELTAFVPNYRYRLILWVSLPLVIGFTLLGAVTQILPTWSMPGFWCLTIILGHYANSWYKLNSQGVKRWLKISIFMIYTLFLVSLLHLSTGLLQKPNQYPFFTGLVSPQNDPSTELIDIVQLRRQLESNPILAEALQRADFIFTNAYYLGGYIGMAIAPLTDIPLVCFSPDSRGFLFWYPVEKLIGKQGLYITLARFAQATKLNRQYASYFQEFREIGTIPLKRAGVNTEIFSVYQGTNLKLVPPEIQKK